MKSVVIYDTKFGNTEKVAEAIARGVGALGSVQVLDAAQASAQALADGPQVVFVGGPTQKRSMSPGFRELVEMLAGQAIAGVVAAPFDTRFRGSTWIMGSAAADAAKRLGKAGARLVAKPESFFIGRGGPLELQTLEAGEIERAEAWGHAVGVSVRAARASARGDQP